jgi:3-phosphoshikimate 1-carboxyvinyltransferase
MKLPATLAIQPIAAPLRAVVAVPGSKSVTNRALLLAAMARGKSILRGALWAEDTAVMVESLQRLGFQISVVAEQSKTANRAIEVEGGAGNIPSSRAQLFIGNAGTAARFLAAFVATGRGEFRMDGTPRMRQRPMAPLFDALRELGADIRCEKTQGFFPAVIRANGLFGDGVEISPEQSSQFVSALMMIAPLIHSRHASTCHPERSEGSRPALSSAKMLRFAQNNRLGNDTPFAIQLRGIPVSEPYLRMTHLLMQKFGVIAKSLPSRRGWSVRRGQGYAAREFAIPPDASAASYFFAAAALCGGSVTVRGLRRKFADNLQGDAEFVEYLQRLGCRVAEREGLCLSGRIKPDAGFPRPLNMADVSDVAVTLAVIAPFLPKPTTIRGLAHARLQETDRVAAVAAELRKIGTRVEMLDDGWKIFPTNQFRPATVDTHNDHRIAMAFSILGLKDVFGNGKPWLRIQNPACVAKTFPNFFETLKLLRTL